MLKIEMLIAMLRKEELQKEAAKAKRYGSNDVLVVETGREATPHFHYRHEGHRFHVDPNTGEVSKNERHLMSPAKQKRLRKLFKSQEEITESKDLLNKLGPKKRGPK